jgi:hypothetical protein
MTLQPNQDSIHAELAALSDKRQRWVDANEENEFGEGIKNLLTELYPENAHFIFELLQNAEDAHANTVSFYLKDDCLVFEHDGKRQFTHRDIESITSIGVSTKRDDPTAIGKFGVGFKAVFAYTESPEVHSGHYHIRIRDLVVPDSDGVDHTPLGHTTRFVFPFNHKKKSKQKAVSEIERGLLELSDITLLFLTHIDTLTFSLPDGGSGDIMRLSHDDHRIEIQSNRPDSLDDHEDEDTRSVSPTLMDGVQSSHWMRFDETVQIIDQEEANRAKPCTIAIAFQLEPRNKRSKERAIEAGRDGMGSDWRIVPVDAGEVSIYFPAVKEDSRLRFHMNAPFASTVGRDSVRDCEVNNELRDHLAALAAKSMTTVRDTGLLSVDFMAVLPLPIDNLSYFYSPFRERLVDQFNNKALTPTKCGKYKRATILRRAPNDITTRLSDSDLAVLSEFQYLRWVANPNQRNSREDQFFASLGIDEWGFEELKEAATEAILDVAAPWLERQSDEWVSKLYARLNKLPRYHEARSAAAAYPIIRVQSRTHVTADTDGIYLSASGQFSETCKLIEPKVWEDEEAEAYLRSLEFDDFTLSSEVETLILPKYAVENPNISFDVHVRELKKIAQVRTELSSQLKTLAIVLCKNAATGNSRFVCGTDAYFESDTLHNYFDGNPDAWFVSPQYGDIDGEEIRELFRSIGVKGDHPRQWNMEAYRKKAPYKFDDHERGLQGFNPNWKIDGLRYALSHPTVKRSSYVWNTLLVESTHLISGVIDKCPNAAFPSDRIEKVKRHSIAGTILKSSEWIPLRCGNFVAASNVESLDSLHSDFDANEDLLAALDEGRSSKLQTAAEALEMPLDIAEFVRTHLEDVKKLRELIESRESHEEVIDSSDSRNRERRRQKLKERREQAPIKESVKKLRSVPKYARSEVDRQSLFAFYHDDDDDVLFCQMCCDPMPFVKRNGEESVECVDLFSKKWAAATGFDLKVMTSLKLVLCPVCSEIYRDYVFEDIDKETALFDHLCNGHDEDFVVCGSDVRRDNKGRTLRFNRTHLGDIQDCLDLDEDTPVDDND